LRALAQPVQCSILVDLDQGGIVEGLVLPDDLDELAVARAALIGHDHAVVRLLLLADPRQPDPYRHI